MNSQKTEENEEQQRHTEEDQPVHRGLLSFDASSGVRREKCQFVVESDFCQREKRFVELDLNENFFPDEHRQIAVITEDNRVDEDGRRTIHR